MTRNFGGWHGPVGIDRWSFDERVDVGSEDHARVRELKMISMQPVEKRFLPRSGWT